MVCEPVATFSHFVQSHHKNSRQKWRWCTIDGLATSYWDHGSRAGHRAHHAFAHETKHAHFAKRLSPMPTKSANTTFICRALHNNLSSITEYCAIMLTLENNIKINKKGQWHLTEHLLGMMSAVGVWAKERWVPCYKWILGGWRRSPMWAGAWAGAAGVRG